MQSLFTSQWLLSVFHLSASFTSHWWVFWSSSIVSAEMLPAIRFVRPLLCLVHQSVSLSYAVLVHQSVALICLSLIRLVHQSLVVFLILIHCICRDATSHSVCPSTALSCSPVNQFVICSPCSPVSGSYLSFTYPSSSPVIGGFSDLHSLTGLIYQPICYPDCKCSARIFTFPVHSLFAC